jgi:hypothetical protein
MNNRASRQGPARSILEPMRQFSLITFGLLLSINLMWASSRTVVEIGHFDIAGGPLVNSADAPVPLPDGVMGMIYVMRGTRVKPAQSAEFFLNGEDLFSEEGYFLWGWLVVDSTTEDTRVFVRVWNHRDRDQATSYWESPLIPLHAGRQQISFATSEWTLHVLSESITQSAGDLDRSPVSAFALHPNYPNPFNAETNIQFDVAEATRLTITAYNVLGREVRRLADGFYPVGEHGVRFDASGLSSGVYLLRLETASGFSDVRRMTLLK